MRLKTRLARIETREANTAPSRGECALLVSILARRDALFWPWRSNRSYRPPIPEIHRRQREYLSGQIGIAAKADGQQNWKDAHAARQNLIAGGYVTATHSSGQVQSVFLTPLGEAYARALVGDRLSTCRSAMSLLVRLHDLSCQTSVAAVRESVLFNRDLVGDPSEWNSLTEIVLPFLACGVVKADNDAQGRVAYTPTDVAFPSEPQVEIEAEDCFDECYVNAFDSERHVLQIARPRDESEIVIPLPATGWGWPCYFPELKENP